MNWDVYNMNMNVTRRCILYIRNIYWLLKGIDKTGTPTRKAVTVEYQKRERWNHQPFLQKCSLFFLNFNLHYLPYPCPSYIPPPKDTWVMLQGTGYKEGRSGMQHNVPTHLHLYCIFRLVESSLAQFDYIQSAEM